MDGSTEEEFPAHLKHKHVASYDAARYPFAALVHAILAPPGDGDAPPTPLPPLPRIHEAEEAKRWLRGVATNGDRPYAVRRNIYASRLEGAGDAFRRGSELDKCYRRFVKEVAVPLLANRAAGGDGGGSGRGGGGGGGGGGGSWGEDNADDGGVSSGDDADAWAPGDGVLFQVKPNFRCHLAGTGHLLVHKHRDSDYHHQPNEVNFWVPLTAGPLHSSTQAPQPPAVPSLKPCMPATTTHHTRRATVDPTCGGVRRPLGPACFGANTVWCESAPGREDFSPFECAGAGPAGPGRVVRFWGHSCQHYTAGAGPQPPHSSATTSLFHVHLNSGPL